MRLIDADELKEQLYRLYWEAVGRKSATLYYLEAIMIVDKASTIDAVPVVRCKDCKYFLSDDKGCNIFYSSSGERKDEK